VTLHTLFDFAVLVEVPGADAASDAATPPWPQLALMALWLAVVVVEAVLVVVLIRSTREKPADRMPND
jgi:hypothetical protein